MEPAPPLSMQLSLPLEVEPLMERPGERNKVQALREALRVEYEKVSHDGVLGGPIEVEIVYYMHPPRQLQSRVEEGSIVYASGRSSPDICKLNECVMTAMQNVLFGQKCQITSLAGRKVYCTNPHTDIRIRFPTHEMPEERRQVRSASELTFAQLIRGAFNPLEAQGTRAFSEPPKAEDPVTPPPTPTEEIEKKC